jgi:hypothetical protein
MFKVKAETSNPCPLIQVDTNLSPRRVREKLEKGLFKDQSEFEPRTGLAQDPSAVIIILESLVMRKTISFFGKHM